MDSQGANQVFVPKWTDSPHIEGGVYLPLDTEYRTPYEDPPQQILDIASKTYGMIKPHPHPPPNSPSLLSDHQNPEVLGAIDPAHTRNFLPAEEVAEDEAEGLSTCLDEFQLLPKLPLELRLKVWREVMSGPRFVEIFFDKDNGACTSSCPFPIPLAIYGESRREALRFYKPLFATEDSPAMVYFDPEVDELHLGIGNFSPTPSAVVDLMHALKQEDVSLIQHMSIDSELAIYQDVDDDAGLMCQILSSDWGGVTPRYRFKGLRSITVIVLPPNGHHKDSSLKHFNGDIIFSSVETNRSEFHAWELSHTSGGGISPVETLEIKPWQLPLGRATWEATLSWIWLECEKGRTSEGDMLSIHTWRFVATGCLMQKPNIWRDRATYLKQTQFMLETGCLHEAPLLEDLLYLEKNKPEWYEQLRARVTDEVENRVINDNMLYGYDLSTHLDPMLMYLSDRGCSCAIGHYKTPDMYDERMLEISKLGEHIGKVWEEMSDDLNGNGPEHG